MYRVSAGSDYGTGSVGGTCGCSSTGDTRDPSRYQLFGVLPSEDEVKRGSRRTVGPSDSRCLPCQPCRDERPKADPPTSYPPPPFRHVNKRRACVIEGSVIGSTDTHTYVEDGPRGGPRSQRGQDSSGEGGERGSSEPFHSRGQRWPRSHVVVKKRGKRVDGDFCHES